MKNSKRLLAVAVAAACSAPMAAFATNGMLMEGYGPIATGMGGASMAYDNGTAALMNNPATLGLMADGSRLDLAVGHLAPSVTLEMMGTYKSKADSFLMPAFGWVKKDGAMAYGVGVFAQGGMGVDFRDVGYYSDMQGSAQMGDFYSQVSVGRIILPFAYNVNEQLSVGATIDYVWANMDLQYGTDFKFRDGSDFTGKATSNGIAAKLGVVYKVNDQVNVGAAYHTKGNLGDLTGASGSVMNGGANATFTFKGFDMPAVLAVGASFQANDRLMVAADFKQIQWSGTMKTPVLVMDIEGMGVQNSGDSFKQDWKDQSVISLGAAYKFSEGLTGRIGANLASNPIPDKYLAPLFPATVENHYTFGLGYNINKAQSIDFSLSHAPETTAKQSDGYYSVKHGQTNWQFMYSHRF